MCGTSYGLTQTDSIPVQTHKTSVFKRVFKGINSFIKEFTNYDTTYIEPQHYKFQAMGQLSTSHERYLLKSRDGQEITLAPETSTTFGPYVGYSLIFLGYTLQFNNLYLGNSKKTFNLSLYTSLGGIDFYYRNHSDYKIKDLVIVNSSTGDNYDTSPLIDSEFDGMHVKSWGFNTYYIFNHRRHSYPATYNQSTCQKRPAGSPLVGIGYGHYDIDMDWAKLYDKMQQTVPDSKATFAGDTLRSNTRYNCYSMYGGYSYNWPFAKNWLVGASASLAISYNRASSDALRFDRFYEIFNISDWQLDGLGRMGIVWNNTRLFAGASAQIHSYSYSKEQFSFNHLFGSVNVYFGINFGKKKAYRKPGKFFEF